MQIYLDALKKDTLTSIQKDLIQDKIKEGKWQSSLFCWNKDLTEDVFGSCLCRKITNEKVLSNLENELKIFFKNEYKNLLFYYYVWQPFSSINNHDDSLYSFGATLYLHDIHVNDGGIFMWKESESESYSWNAICPKENMLIVNDKKENHVVTMVNPKNLNFRFTIQIWGVN